MIDSGLLPLSGFSRAVFSERAKKFGWVLAQNDIPLAIVGYNPDLYYFTGSIQQGFALITSEGRQAYFVRKDFERAQIESPLEDIKPLKNFRGLQEGVVQLLGHYPARIALSFDVIPVALYKRLQAVFRDVLFIDGSGFIRSLRMIKDKAEIDNIRKGIEIYDKVINKLPDLIHEGMTEAEAEATLILAMRGLGHQSHIRMRGWNQEAINGYVYAGRNAAVPSFLDAPLGGVGANPAVAMGGGAAIIQRDDPVVFDASPGVNGYVSDQTRTFVFGKLSEKLRNAYHVTAEMISTFETEARPGDSCADWFDKLESMAEKARLVENFMGCGKKRVLYIGHGIGLELNDWPVLGKKTAWRLEPGMVLALEPKMVFPESGAVGLENDYLVTDTGVKRLSITDDTLIRL